MSAAYESESDRYEQLAAYRHGWSLRFGYNPVDTYRGNHNSEACLQAYRRGRNDREEAENAACATEQTRLGLPK